MGIPALYQGSQYAPVPFVPIPPDPDPAPELVSSEIGAVNAFTLVVTFNENVSASNYSTGVTIKVNGTATSITSATRQANHAIVRYVIPVLWHGSGDSVTWEYDSATGSIVAESDSITLKNVAAQSVTNNCEYTGLLDLQADTLALNDNDPVSAWSDASGQNHNFTAAGTSTITRQTDGDGYHYIQYSLSDINYFDGGTGEWIDNLNSFTAFCVSDGVDVIVDKINNTSTGAGWSLEENPFDHKLSMIIQEDGGNNWIQVRESSAHSAAKSVFTGSVISKSEIHIYRNGLENVVDLSNPPVSNYSSTEHVQLGAYGNLSTWGGKQYAVMICVPAPNAANRAALETRLGARYGLTVP